MLGYLHTFHAGNGADVFKHALLVQLILALRKKDTPFCVLDTHGGSGLYDLWSESARKNREFEAGINRFWSDTGSSTAVDAYLDLVRTLNRDGVLRWYPGSPWLAHALLRQHDRLIVCEKHPVEYRHLRALFARCGQVAVHHRDGYEALKALLPPTQRRGLVLMDPSFEVPGEYMRLTAALTTVRRRWSGAVVAVWYPIIEREPSQGFLDRVKDLGIPSILVAELGMQPYQGPVGLHGSGMLLVNPPWGFAETLEQMLPLLCDRLRVTGPGEMRLQWLVPAP